MNLGRTELASATEISLTLAWVSMVVLHHSQFHPDAAVLEQADMLGRCDIPLAARCAWWSLRRAGMGQ